MRCDNRRPDCSRCNTKAIKCYYPATTPKGTGTRIHKDDAPTAPQNLSTSSMADSPTVEHRQEASNDGDVALDSTTEISDPGFANFGGVQLDWDDSEIDFATFLDSPTNDEILEYPSSGSSSLVRHSTPSSPTTVQKQQAIVSPSVSIPKLPTSTTRSFIQRPKMQTGTQRIANLILPILKSYPQMMLRHNTLPPFIHPQLISSDVEDAHVEPLTNCISIVHMISNKVRGSRKLFWKNVRLECERLCAEVR